MRFKSLVATLFLTVFLAPNTYAAEGGKGKKLWKISAAILGAVTIADVQSSIGRREMTPWLRSADGRFQGRGVSIKSAIVGGALLGQYFMMRNHPQAAGWAAGTNFAAAAATGAVVARNHMR